MDQWNPEAGVSIYQAGRWEITLQAEGSSPTAWKHRGGDIQEAVSRCMWLGCREPMVRFPLRQVGQSVNGPRQDRKGFLTKSYQDLAVIYEES